MDTIDGESIVDLEELYSWVERLLASLYASIDILCIVDVQYFKETKRKPLYAALQKMKDGESLHYAQK